MGRAKQQQNSKKETETKRLHVQQNRFLSVNWTKWLNILRCLVVVFSGEFHASKFKVVVSTLYLWQLIVNFNVCLMYSGYNL